MNEMKIVDKCHKMYRVRQQCIGRHFQILCNTVFGAVLVA